MQRFRYSITFFILALIVFTYPAYPQNTSEPGSLLLNEFSPFQNIKYVELINPSDSPVEAAGWIISIDSESIELGADTPAVPAGGFIVISYGPELPTVPPETILLQATISTGYNPMNGVVVLSDSNGPVDGVAWGFPGETDTAPLVTLPRILPEYEVFPIDTAIYNSGDVFFRVPGDTNSFNSGENWVFRTSVEATVGAENNFPGPWIMEPPDGTSFASDFALGVTGLEWSDEIEFEVARDAAFTDILIDEKSSVGTIFINTLTRGDYFWHVRGIKNSVEFPWSPSQTFTREAFNIDDLLNTFTSDKTDENGIFLAQVKGGGDPWAGYTVVEGSWVGLTHQVQHKDTAMICIDGSPMNGDYNWDTAHPLNALGPRYNRRYCVRACIAMLAAQYGNKLSQDRISYYVFEEAGNMSQSAANAGHLGDPYMDLGFDVGISGSDIGMALDWVYGQPFGNSTVHPNLTTIFTNQTPEMDCIKDFILDNRAVIRSFSGHAVVIEGYVIVQAGTPLDMKEYIRVFDPWFNPGYGAITWREYFQSTAAWYHFPPDTGIPTRVDEPGVTADSDGDGLVDFDEINRFNTDPNNDDSDFDEVTDKNDIKGYCFNDDGSYFRRERDIDGDGAAKELDPDNDNTNDVSAHDGCEDTNKDGLFQSGTETHPFYGDDDYTVVNPECMRGTLTRETHAFRHDAEVDLEYWYTEELTIVSASPESDAFIHPHTFHHSMDHVDKVSGCTIVGEISLSGMCQVKLEVDETTGEYFLITDSDLAIVPFTHTMTCPWISQELPNMTVYFIDNGVSWPLGVPIEENGGRVCRGRWETPAASGADGPFYVEWEIWIDPPSN